MSHLLQKRTAGEEWSAADMAGWAVGDLESLAKLRSMATATKVVAAFLTKYGPEVSGTMRQVALLELNKRNTGRVFSVGSQFTASWTSGNGIVVTEAEKGKEDSKATMTFEVDSKAITIQATPVQMLPDEKDRKGLRFLLPVIATWFKVKNGQVKLALNPTEMLPSMEGSAFSAPGMHQFETVVRAVFEPKTEGLMVGGRTMSGWAWFQHVKVVLTTCSFDEYYTLHSGFVYDVLQFRSKNSYIQMMASEKFPAALNKAIEDLTVSITKGCFVLAGPVPMMECPLVTGTLKKGNIEGAHEGFARSRAGMQKTRAMLGEALAHYRLIEDGRSFSSMMSRAETEIVMLVSIGLGLMSQGNDIQIVLDSLGPVEFLHSSFQRWIKKEASKKTYRFILPAGAATSAQTVHSPYVTVKAEPERVLVWNHAREVAAEVSLGEAVKHSRDVFAGCRDIPRYVIRTGLYGELLSDKDRHIYTYGTAWEFQGLVSSEPDLVMMKRSPVGAHYTVAASKLASPIEARASDWYKIVQNHCTLMLAAPYRCPIYASEACNLVCAQRERIRLRFTADGDAEFSTLTFNDQLEADIGFDPEKAKAAGVKVAAVIRRAGEKVTHGNGGESVHYAQKNGTQEVEIDEHEEDPAQNSSNSSNSSAAEAERKATMAALEEMQGDV